MKKYRVNFANAVDVENEATQKMEVATKALDHCLSKQKRSGDRNGIGYESQSSKVQAKPSVTITNDAAVNVKMWKEKTTQV